MFLAGKAWMRQWAMKASSLLARVLVGLFVGVLGLSLSAYAAASSAGIESLRQLQRMETLSYRVVTNYNLYAARDNDPRVWGKVSGHIQEMQALAQKLSSVPSVQAGWQSFRSQTATPPRKDDLLAAKNAQGALEQFVATLDAAIKNTRTSGSLAIDANAELLWQQAILMDVMTTQYLKNSADVFGGAVAGGETSIDLDKLALKFDSQQAKLKAAYRNHPQISVDLGQVDAKWAFIKKSLLNFNQNHVPFLIATYGAQITDYLQNAYNRVEK